MQSHIFYFLYSDIKSHVIISFSCVGIINHFNVKEMTRNTISYSDLHPQSSQSDRQTFPPVTPFNNHLISKNYAHSTAFPSANCINVAVCTPTQKYRRYPQFTIHQIIRLTTRKIECSCLSTKTSRFTNGDSQTIFPGFKTRMKMTYTR
jgi:hypothetical protein